VHQAVPGGNIDLVEGQIAGAMRGATRRTPRSSFISLAMFEMYAGVIRKQMKPAFNQVDVSAQELLGGTDDLFDFAVVSSR